MKPLSTGFAFLLIAGLFFFCQHSTAQRQSGSGKAIAANKQVLYQITEEVEGWSSLSPQQKITNINQILSTLRPSQPLARIKWLTEKAKLLAHAQDLDVAIQTLDSLERLFPDDIRIVEKGVIFQAKAYVYGLFMLSERAVDYYYRAAFIFEELKYYRLAAHSYRKVSEYQFYARTYRNSVETALIASNLLQQSELGGEQFHEISKATYNVLGLSYLELGFLDSAIYWLDRAIEEAAFWKINFMLRCSPAIKPMPTLRKENTTKLLSFY
jgi:tetratricopeptide (TPR) repeat protein